MVLATDDMTWAAQSGSNLCSGLKAVQRHDHLFAMSGLWCSGLGFQNGFFGFPDPNQPWVKLEESSRAGGFLWFGVILVIWVFLLVLNGR